MIPPGPVPPGSWEVLPTGRSTRSGGKGQLWTWRHEEPLHRATVLVDIDGVLSDATGRQRFLHIPEPDWRGFFGSAAEDPVVGEVKVLLDLLDPALSVVLLTARPAWIQAATLGWIDEHAIRWDLLVMREGRAYPSTRAFKEASVVELRRHGFELRLALEDDRRNVEMFEAQGVPCLYIHSGYYD